MVPEVTTRRFHRLIGPYAVLHGNASLDLLLAAQTLSALRTWAGDLWTHGERERAEEMWQQKARGMHHHKVGARQAAMPYGMMWRRAWATRMSYVASVVRTTSSASSTRPRWLRTVAGTPSTVVRAATSRLTVELAPMMALSPTVIRPTTTALGAT